MLLYGLFAVYLLHSDLCTIALLAFPTADSIAALGGSSIVAGDTADISIATDSKHFSDVYA